MAQDELFKDSITNHSDAPLWTLTNEENLKQILSSGIFRTREGYTAKYYSDILDSCPGRIPLFVKAVSAELIADQNLQTNDLAVVIIRLKKEAEKFADAMQPVTLIEHPLPASMIEAIFFAEKEKRDSFASGLYDNLDLEAYTLKDERSYFRKTVAGQKEAFSKAAEPTTANETGAIYRQADALGGVIAAIYRQGRFSAKMLERLKSFLRLRSSEMMLTEAGKILAESVDGAESKLITVILQTLMENGSAGLGEETFSILARHADESDFEPKHRSALLEQLERVKEIVTSCGDLSGYLATYHKSPVIRAFLLCLNYKEESEILRTDFPSNWKVSEYEQFLALCFRSAWRGWSLLNASRYKSNAGFNDLIGRWMCNLIAGKELFPLSTDFLKKKWLSAFWETVNFAENKEAESFALRVATDKQWRCGIKQTITIPEQKWFFMNQLSWKNSFKIEVRDSVANVELSYNSQKLRQALLDHSFSGELLEEALRLIP
jgi:hypothetical protein